jgi:hypothetical protein
METERDREREDKRERERKRLAERELRGLMMVEYLLVSCA